MRILYMANAPWCGTGYGSQGKELVPRLKKLGHDMAYFAFWGLTGSVLRMEDGTPVLPPGKDPWGADILEAHCDAFGADVLITLLDVWVGSHFSEVAQTGKVKWLPWFPVDQEPVPAVVLENLQDCYRAVTFSRFGEEEMQKTEFADITRYAPHGVNREVFYPGSREEARTRLKLPQDAFIIGMVAANKGHPSRKCFPEQFLAFARFQKSHPEALLYVHTNVTASHGGSDLRVLAEKCGIPGDKFAFCGQYGYVVGMSADVVASTFRAIDLLTNASMGEGFGLPIIEAQACGTPVVVGNWTSMPELVHNGWVVRKGHPFYTPLEAWVNMPDIDGLVEAYEGLYETAQDEPRRARYAHLGRAKMRMYDWDVVINDYWKRILDEVTDECRGESDTRPTEG